MPIQSGTAGVEDHHVHFLSIGAGQRFLKRGQLEEKDFEIELHSYCMAGGAKRIFLEKFEERMQEVIAYPEPVEQMSYLK